MNRHLSVFRPYDREASHEDQLTRAAMIVMRAIPLAHDAFLRLATVDGVSLAELPPGSFDMQTRYVTDPLPIASDGDGDASEEFDELVSVFLTPDVERPVGGRTKLVKEDPRRQRLDGVIRHLPRLVVAIESKLYEGQSDRQALRLNLASGPRPKRSRKQDLGWHRLLERWLLLMEAGMLGAAERVLVDDFFGFAEEHFAWLLPFTSLARAGDNEHRRGRRLQNLLAHATGLEVRDGWPPHVRLAATSVQRAALTSEPQALVLAMWPGEQKPQAEHVYGDRDRVRRLTALNGEGGWRVKPLPHVAFWTARPQQRWYLTCDLDADDYARRWIEDLDRVGRVARQELEPKLWPWLLERGYARPEDRQGLDKLRETGRKEFHMRPGLEVTRRWGWEEARRLDDRGDLSEQVRASIDRVLRLLDEPPLVPESGA